MHVKPDGVVGQVKHDLVVFGEVIVIELYQNPYRSKETGDPWKQIAVKLSVLDHPKFEVNKRFKRDRQTLLLPSIKQKCAKRKMPLEITYEETKLDQALEEITDKEKLACEKGSKSQEKKREKKQLQINTG